jgi:hypothetical protein
MDQKMAVAKASRGKMKDLHLRWYWIASKIPLRRPQMRENRLSRVNLYSCICQDR